MNRVTSLGDSVENSGKICTLARSSSSPWARTNQQTATLADLCYAGLAPEARIASASAATPPTISLSAMPPYPSSKAGEPSYGRRW